MLRAQRQSLPPRRLALLCSLGLALGLSLAIATGRFEVHELVTPGGLSETANVLRLDFGDDAVRADQTGYDGQIVYTIARFFPDLDAAPENIHKPQYRMLRILLPALASPAPAGSPTVLALVALNIIGLGVAVWAVASLLESVAAPTAGAALACLPLLLGVASTTVGPVAWGLSLAGLVLGRRGQHRLAILILVLAALSRETASVAALLIGCGIALRATSWRQRWTSTAYVIPGLVTASWLLLLGVLVGGGLPRRMEPLGFLDLQGSMGIFPAIVFLLGAIGAVVWRDVPEASLICLGFTSWMILYTSDVLDPIAIARVNGLPIVLGLAALARIVGNGLGSTSGDAVELVPDVRGDLVG